MRRIVTILAVVATALVAVFGLFWTAQRRLIYFPTQAVGDVSAVSLDSEDVAFTTDDGLTLSAWWIPASDTPDGTTIVVFHGNAGNRADRAPLARALAGQGYSVLLVDYRGYGGNPGSPTEDGLLLDAKAAATYVGSRSDVDADRIVYFGESLGAAVAIAIAEDSPPSALVLRSPFTSLPDVAATHYPYLPTGLLLRDRYPSIDTIGDIDVPTLVIAGSQDTIIPIAQSRELYEAAPGPKRFVIIHGADHNDPALTHGPILIDEITTFLEGVRSSG
ncbi:MAG: alpha/beta hydrolase [Actinomycetota bacterium]